MTESTLQTAAVPEPNIAEPPPPRKAQLPALIRRHPWIWGTAGLILLSFVLVRWAGTRPGYDPYGWLTWGYQTLRLNLDLGGAPSWKPLTWLLDTPFALFGRAALWLWMTFAVTMSLAGAIFAGRLVWKLCRRQGIASRPALTACVFGGACLLGIQDYFHFVLSVQSDPVIVTLCLAAVDCALAGRHRWTLVLAVLAALGRPEAWPFLGLYAIWTWRRIPSMRWMIIAGLAVVPALWFGMPWVTNGKPFISGQLALNSPRELHQNKIIGTLHRFTALHYLTVELLALGAVVIGWLRRDRLLLGVAAATAAWVLIEVAFVLHGWPGVPRYLFEPAGVVAVMAGVTLGWILHEGQALLGRRGLPRWGALVTGALIVLTLAPGAWSRLHAEHRDLLIERKRAVEISQLQGTIDAIGGAHRVVLCGRPVIRISFVSILAWMVGRNDGQLGHRPELELLQQHPSVAFRPVRYGWAVFPWHARPHRRRLCARLKISYIYPPDHPQGTFAPYVRGPRF